VTGNTYAHSAMHPLSHARTMSLVLLLPLFVVAFGTGFASAQTADFGKPPSGEIPILFNDHTVYAAPDTLRKGRVLAALVKGGQIFVPLRSMFEQMGATVSVSADGKTISAEKTGASVVVTLGKAEVLVNGESRPLDVAPIVYRGVVLVPVRVISEGLGAYVQWVPERRLVVVRYVSAPPPAPPVVTPAPVVTLAPTPVPVPVVPPPVPIVTAAPHEVPGFIQAAISAPRNYNEFSSGQYCPETFTLSAAYAFKHSPIAVKVDYRQDAYVTSDNRTDAFGNHYTQFATIDGGVALTPVFLARQSSLDGRLEYQIASPRVYVGVGYIRTDTNYGYPHLTGLGVGIEKLPDMHRGVNFYGSAFYYPNTVGTYTIANPASPNVGQSFEQQYAITKYDIGVSLVAVHSPIYIYGGISGDRYSRKQNAPIDQQHDGPYVGLGLKL
jgi:hypothetical protein